MFRGIAFVLLLALVGFVNAQPPDAEAQRQQELARKPQYERLLKGEDAKTAAKLNELIGEQEKIDAYEGAVQLAKELLALRVKVQGQDHWETVDEKFRITQMETLASRPAAKRAEWRAAVQELLQAGSLESKGQYGMGYPAIKRFSELCVEFLGEDHPVTAISYNNVAGNLILQRYVCHLHLGRSVM